MAAKRVLVALDDTDSAQGGCTTHAALALMHQMGWTLRGMPRLVRLNPNCPHKTRGNGAVVMDIGSPSGPRVQIGAWQGEPIHAYPDSPPRAIEEDHLAQAWAALRNLAQPDSSPAMVASMEPLPAPVYWQCVQTAVDAVDAVLPTTAWGGRGRIGCAGALAWRGPATSHELLLYRQAAQWGSPRLVGDVGPLTGTFHSYDSDRRTFVPNTPCPVLAGIRAVEPEPLRPIVDRITKASEPLLGWAIWTTNQASGDHVLSVQGFADAPPWSTITTHATVADRPSVREGGHVEVPLTDARGAPCTAVAFEPTGSLRDGVRSLQPGDEVVVTGALEGTLRLESLQLVAGQRKRANPQCCGRAMKSRGTEAGYRCPTCGAKRPESAATWATVNGSWEARISARRHLHRPLDW